MKRLFKMLSLLSILIIVGSCSDSKAINVSTPTIGNQQYVQFVNYEANVYPVLNVSINGVNIGTGTSYPIDKNSTYTVTWTWIAPNSSGINAMDNNTISSRKFTSNNATIIMRLGTDIYKGIYYEDYLN